MEKTVAQETFETFNIPLDDQDENLLVKKHTNVLNFMEDHGEFFAELSFHWLRARAKDGGVPLTIISSGLVKDLVELGMVWGYLLKESELRRL